MLILLIIASTLFVALITVTAEDLIQNIKWRNGNGIISTTAFILAEILIAFIAITRLAPCYRGTVGSIIAILLGVVVMIYTHSYWTKRHAKSKLP